MTHTKQNELTITERLVAPTPPLFRALRTIGLVLGAMGATLLGLEQQGITVPSFVTSLIDNGSIILGAVSTTAGVVSVAIAQLAVDFDALKKKHELDNI